MSTVSNKKAAPEPARAADLITACQAGRPQSPSPGAYFRWKGILDRLGAAILLVPGIPIMALLVVLVRLTSRGPGIYSQARVGRHGRRFTMYKIRTMRQDAETNVGPVWTQEGDPRMTRLGKLLRRLHLDELPQLFNVLRGEMSLVGPRPERPEFVRVLAEVIPGYRDRLAVPPGITGLAQIYLPPDTDLSSVWCKLLLDLEYVERAGLWLDVRIFLHTLLHICKMPDLWLLRLLGLTRHVTTTIPDIYPLPAHDVDLTRATSPIDVLIQAANTETRHIKERHSPGKGRHAAKDRPSPK
jgi:lipopolysaccharide/colanic/teichoic acid biosynthesis glycosyltransferase